MKKPSTSSPSLPLAGQVAIVTGSEQGIGRGLAIALAQAGARVVVNYVWSRDRAAETAALIEEAGSEAIIVRADVSKAADCRKLIQAALKKWDRLDAVVNNAGRHIYQLLADVTEKDWDTQLETNLKGAFLLSQQAVLSWRKAKSGGRIVNITSCGSQQPFPGSAAYTASKGGLLMLTRQLALELAPEGILVNAIAPGVIRTPLSEPLLAKPNARRGWEACIPARRIGNPSDLAGAVVFLCSDASAYITGQQLHVDGGWNLNLAWSSI